MRETVAVGRELDEAIFEEVYGYVRMEDRQLPEGMKEKEMWLNFCATPEAGAMHEGPPPPFSTEMNSAWLLMEAMAGAGKAPRMEWKGNVWEVDVIHTEDRCVQGRAETAAEAICRVALRVANEEER